MPDKKTAASNPDRVLLKDLTSLSEDAHRLRKGYEKKGVDNGAVFTAMFGVEAAQNTVDEALHKLRQAFEDREMFNG